MQFCSSSLHQTQMETEASPTKQKRYDLSMSKRTRRTNISKIATEVNSAEERLLMFQPVTSEEEKKADQALNCTPNSRAIVEEIGFALITSEEPKEGEQELNCTADNKLVIKETVFAPAAPRPSLKELIQVTNKEERNATEVSEQNLVRENASQEEKENLAGAVAQQRQLVKDVKPPGVVRLCAKTLNQMIKVRYSPKQKSVVPLIAI